jgi:hypothetical protein
MPIPEPLCLSDEQITTVMSLARPLSPDQRSRFLEMLAAKLNGQREIGDGTLYKICAELQRQVFTPPQFVTDSGANKSRCGRPQRDDDSSEDDRPRRRPQPRTLGAL